ncbi:MAG: hypothetical protein HOW73_29125 [Polyangiaceae bacterium]|nr:hypothetical protein [Polyangiaceae bacterium]
MAPRLAEMPSSVELLRTEDELVERIREHDPETWAERLGRFSGGLLAPLAGAVSRIRSARMFHPDGVVYRASVVSIGATPELARLGRRLEGTAIVRLSSAWWRGEKEWPDVLGMAIRFLRPGQHPNAKGLTDSQDLLLATIRFPWTMPFAPFTTRVSSFLWNHFHAVSPFEIDGIGRVKVRARSPRIANVDGLPRAAHLAREVRFHGAVYELEIRRMDRRPLARSWEPLARIVLEAPIAIDQASLRFSAFRCGRGIRPVGYVHALRHATYAASQDARSD